MKRLFLPFVLLFLVIPCFSADSQVEFVAKLVSVETTSADVGTLHLQLTADFNLDVKVTEITEIRGEGDVELTLADLEPDMLLRIEGLFADGGILAREITAIQFGAAKFSVRGAVEAVDTAKQELKLLGLVIKVAETTEIKDADGEVIELDAVHAGDMAWVEGEVTPNGLVASEIRIRPLDLRPPRLVFEGIVTEIGEDTITVQLRGVDNIPVRITEETEIRGELVVGALVKVAGTIGTDLSVTATRITVSEALQVAPAHLRLKPGQTVQVIVILRTHPEEDVSVEVVSKDPAVAEVEPATVVIPAGKIVGAFTVTAKAEGTTIIDVKLPESLGGTVAGVNVDVRTNEDPHGRADIRWQPNQLKIRMGRTAAAMLMLDRPLDADVEVAISVKEGSADLLEGPEKVTIPAGKRAVHVEFKAGTRPGNLILRATLPESAGSGYADLGIEVRD